MDSNDLFDEDVDLINEEEEEDEEEELEQEQEDVDMEDQDGDDDGDDDGDGDGDGDDDDDEEEEDEGDGDDDDEEDENEDNENENEAKADGEGNSSDLHADDTSQQEVSSKDIKDIKEDDQSTALRETDSTKEGEEKSTSHDQKPTEIESETDNKSKEPNTTATENNAETEKTTETDNTEVNIVIDSKPKQSMRSILFENSKNMNVLDIVPFVAIPTASGIHSMAVSKGPKWLLLGGEDGFIRKYDFFQSVEGNNPLTVTQKHQLIDSISYGGVLSSYWENEQPMYKDELIKHITDEHNKAQANKKNKKELDPATITSFDPVLSPTYSLALQSESKWALSGLQSGGISLQSIRQSEGSVQYYFKHGKGEKQHSDTVSSLLLNSSEDKFLSGSWDMKILQWDLNNGAVVNSFIGSTGQISQLEYRPVGGHEIKAMAAEDDDEDLESLFGDDDTKADNTSESINVKKSARRDGDDDENEKDEDKQQDDQDEKTGGDSQYANNKKRKLIENSNSRGIDIERSQDIFLSSSINGVLDIWDTRLPTSSNKVININVPKGSTPWCMSSCWSVDGNSVFAGRRNATVEEFDVRNTKVPSKVLKFPSASGPVSAVKPLNNGHNILCGCVDNIRLYDLRLYEDQTSAHDGADSKETKKKSRIPFMIIPGHNGGTLSDLYVDPTSRFVISTSGNRGWSGKSTDYCFIYEINGVSPNK